VHDITSVDTAVASLSAIDQDAMKLAILRAFLTKSEFVLLHYGKELILRML
jgi:hypothetical protein